MDLKHTQGLSVYIDHGLKTGELVLHPNDGFDLGLVTAHHSVSIYAQPPTDAASGPSRAGKVLLRNSCRSGTLQVSRKQWELMGREKSVTLFIKTDQLFIVSQKAKKA